MGKWERYDGGIATGKDQKCRICRVATLKVCTVLDDRQSPLAFLLCLSEHEEA